jgi:aspartate aminotransferase/aminotransferase
MWSKALIQNPELLENPQKKILLAGMGHPTLPVDPEVVDFAVKHWQDFADDVHTFHKDVYAASEVTDIVNHEGLVRHYGHPQGDLCYRKQAADALSDWYGFALNADDVMFTNGGAASLYNIFNVIAKQHPKGARIILPTPSYPLHISSHSNHISHPINVLAQPGYKITAKAIHESIESAFQAAAKDHALPAAIIICDPYNPLGTTLDKAELPKIVEVLKQYPSIMLVLDEPYAEMTFGEKHSSLYSCCKAIRDRVVVIRSATKSFSLAGERMSITMCQNKYLMGQLLESNILTSGHAATSQQAIYAYGLSTLNENKLKRIENYYKPQLEYAQKRLFDMGAEMADKSYKPNSTFYVLCDLKDMYYLKRTPKALICETETGPHLTAEEIAYTLLFSESILITPLSYYGLESNTPYFRITCGIGVELLTELFNRLEEKLVEARLRKQQLLMEQLLELLARLERINPGFVEEARWAIHLKQKANPAVSLAKQLKESIEVIADCLLKGGQLLTDFNKANIAMKSMGLDLDLKPTMLKQDADNYLAA